MKNRNIYDYKMQEYINKKPRHIKQMEEKSRLFTKGRLDKKRRHYKVQI
jgi:hypothetical protein